jgi:hypothetical protein
LLNARAQGVSEYENRRRKEYLFYFLKVCFAFGNFCLSLISVNELRIRSRRGLEELCLSRHLNEAPTEMFVGREKKGNSVVGWRLTQTGSFQAHYREFAPSPCDLPSDREEQLTGCVWRIQKTSG